MEAGNDAGAVYFIYGAGQSQRPAIRKKAEKHTKPKRNPGLGTPERSVPTRPPKTLTWPIEVTLDMQMRSKLLQRTLGGGGNRGLI